MRGRDGPGWAFNSRPASGQTYRMMVGHQRRGATLLARFGHRGATDAVRRVACMQVADGKTLKTAGAEIFEINMSASEQVFQKLWRPEVMFILMLIAIYGIIW